MIPVVEVKANDVPLYRQFVGQVYGLKDIPIRARVEGYLLDIHFKEGQSVKKDQLLYSIDPEPLLAELSSQQAKVAEAKTKLANAENQLKRYEPLAEINAVSKSDLDFAKAQRDAALASLNAAKGNLRSSQIQLSYCKIKSPINGFIGKTNARVGEFVGRDPNPVILNTISKIDTVRVQFFLTEAEYLQVARYIRDHKNQFKSDSVKRDPVELGLILSDGSVHPYKGKVDFVNREVDATTGAILVQASFPNPDRIIRPGQFARVKVKMEEKKNTIAIPQRCVTEMQGQFSVMMVTDSSTVQSVPIKLGEKVSDLWLVESGLKIGDQIVLEGLQKVRSGMKIQPDTTVFNSVSSVE
ncbi:efflux RND transporter periplasmic adaptor subunit [Reichenbachiella ulvae]|uniref:Efflux RND transporter periplasmic adaptor subunit n=1 Tax=Reichenbachiella ulvae TaxID=2980104 RepID=A0ABT3CQJ8_9BACT|nr:efflux RND transporter periplasmic adaptor subunit [Reichenbachiella ulvae]MCV9385789.1 efflux RND transporter periplasmic adaptor subunit [Reichenbachiella ulvae]